jgi:large subunit ribosomal protein L21
MFTATTSQALRVCLSRSPLAVRMPTTMPLPCLAARYTSSSSTADTSRAPKRDLFAVVHLSGKQHRLMAGDQLVTEKLEGPDVGDVIRLRKVLLVGSAKNTAIGQPLVREATVLAEVEQQTLSKKVLVFKKKRRKGYRRLVGWRHPITVLRIRDIMVDFEHIAEPSIVASHDATLNPVLAGNASA